MTTTPQHIDANDLAALAEGRAPELAERTYAHLATCRTCLATYAEAVRMAHQAALGSQPPLRVPTDLLAAGLAAGEPVVRRPRFGLPRRVWVPAAMVTAAVLVWFVLPAPRSDPLSNQQITVISQALQTQSIAGPVFPDVAPLPAGAAPVYRSGAASSEAVVSLLHDVVADRRDLPTDPRTAYWLGAAYLSAGQIGTATDLIRVSRQTYPGDRRLLILDALAAYRRSDLAEAESRLRQALAADPTDAVARFDLAVVLHEADRTWEARQVLDAGVWDEASGLASRATSLRDTLDVSGH